ncbi:phosphoribosylglycinamide formyltransferase [Candidatus Pelagibacter sp.]|jgi:phosphoribosylglycinamide formyltransferase 1|nr:phosphoribosylglycinamide formyltransferase [Candidatus Pelagibacter sp.]
MIKSNGFKKINTAVFISGTGSNLRSLIQHSLKKNSKFKIDLIISNNAKAKGLIYAKSFKKKKYIVEYKNIRNAEKKILLNLDKNKIQLICLAGFMKILSRKFIKNFKGKILNIHPSYLPRYKGLNTHQRVIDNNEKYSGCTVHFVSSKLDAGKIILQKKVKILKKDTAKSLSKRILKQEHIIYSKALNKIYSNL